eukprot:TRINITY_DN51004_c0_g1_i1.p1 TRINITY_DN51004_c0_g1~~TRINITY_DN51004_c0_g1_i1.p1  ORF type:complete len:840 (-),score=114.70 TRINITY_DN51004_c0_g1_i1:646-3165(-)
MAYTWTVAAAKWMSFVGWLALCAVPAYAPMYMHAGAVQELEQGQWTVGATPPLKFDPGLKQMRCYCEFIDNSNFVLLGMAHIAHSEKWSDFYLRPMYERLFANRCDENPFGGLSNPATQSKCLPGALVLALFCVIMAAERAEVKQVDDAAIIVKRAQTAADIVYKLRDCLHTTVWGEAVQTLLLHPHLQAHVIPRWPQIDLGRQHGRWHDETFARCSRAPPHCWPPMSGVLSPEGSCLLCCSVRAGPRGHTECFDDEDPRFTFETCCGTHGEKMEEQVGAWLNLNESTTTAFLASIPQEGGMVNEWRGPVVPVDWSQVRQEVLQGCGGRDSDMSAYAKLGKQAAEIREWLRQGSGQRVWPEAESYIAQGVCTMNDTWLATPPPVPQPSGAELLYQAGILCPAGCCAQKNDTCPLERRSTLKTFASVPCDGTVRNCDFHRGGDANQVHFVHAIEYGHLPKLPNCESVNESKGGVAILLGQPSGDNIGHFLADMIFLATVLRMARLGAFGTRKLWLVPTIWRVWNCNLPLAGTQKRPQECSIPSSNTGRPPWTLDGLPSFLWAVVATFFPEGQDVQWIQPFRPDYSWVCPTCFDAVVQQFRAFSGEASIHNEFRRSALQLCNVTEASDFPDKKRLVLLRRTRLARSWGDMESLLEQLLGWSKRHSWSVDVVTLGELNPCDQVKALHDASITIAVFSTEHYLASAFVPERAAMIVLHTMWHGKGRSEGGSTSRSDFDSIRGPGMERNSSVAQRYRELCNGHLSDGRRNDEPAVASFMTASQVANARNLLFLALNNITCHAFDWQALEEGCGDGFYGAASAPWSEMLKAVDVAAEHLHRFFVS